MLQNPIRNHHSHQKCSHQTEREHGINKLTCKNLKPPAKFYSTAVEFKTQFHAAPPIKSWTMHIIFRNCRLNFWLAIAGQTVTTNWTVKLERTLFTDVDETFCCWETFMYAKLNWIYKKVGKRDKAVS